MRIALLFVALAGVLPVQGQFRRVDPPALADSGMPYLTAGEDGRVYLAWTETTPEKEHRLRFSRWTGQGWGEGETIARGKRWFVNWADFGSLTVRRDGSMLAHWLTRAEGGGSYGYGIRVARREANRPEWRETHGMSLDEKVDYAGFLAFAPGGEAAIYLSPPAEGGAAAHGASHDEHEHRKTVRFIVFGARGERASEVEIDADACSCCQTALGKTRSGWIAAYRDHRAGEIRDISVVRFREGRWTEPQNLHADGWKINGCPTDGPSLVASGDRVAVAWLTRAGNEPKVQLALSSDEGKVFGRPVRIDSGNPLGRPSITPFDGSSYLVTWLEKTNGGEGVAIRMRRVGMDGAAGEAVTVATAPAGRAAGFPKAVVAGEQIVLAWRDGGVRAVLVPKSAVIHTKAKGKE